MIYAIIVSGNLSHHVLVLRPHNEAIPPLENALHDLKDVHTLDGLAGSNIKLSIDIQNLSSLILS